MASGTLKPHDTVSSIAYTLNSDAFYGSINAKRMGKLALISIDVYPKNEILPWNRVTLLTLTGVEVASWTNFALASQESPAEAVNGNADPNSVGANIISVLSRSSTISANTYIRGQCMLVLK